VPPDERPGDGIAPVDPLAAAPPRPGPGGVVLDVTPAVDVDGRGPVVDGVTDLSDAGVTAEDPHTGPEPDEVADEFEDDHPVAPFFGPRAVLAAMIAAYIVVFGRLTWIQQTNYGTFGFDMGIFDQEIWLLSRFKDPFVTIRGLSMWGNHVNPNVLLLVPVYWLGGGPHALYFIETVAMALGAVPVWLLCREAMDEPWAALVVAGAYLLYPSLEWINWWHFHPEALAITPMLFAWWFARHGNWWRYALCVVLVASCKEDAALAVIAMGVLVAIKFNWRAGLATAAGAALWMAVALRVIMPDAVGGASPFYLDRFSAFGNSLPSIIYNVFRHPSRVYHVAFKADRLSYYRMLWTPVAWLALLDPVILICLPTVLVNVTSNFGYTHSIRYHYSSLVIAGTFIAVAETLRRLRRRAPLRRAAMGLLAATALAANVAWSPSPIGVDYHSGIWALHKPDRALEDAAVHLVPAGAGVSASYSIDSHLSHRVHIYEWPNPFHSANWGIDDKHPDPTSNVDYLVLDTGLNADSAPILQGRLAQGGGFRVIYHEGPYLVAQRVGPGG